MVWFRLRTVVRVSTLAVALLLSASAAPVAAQSTVLVPGEPLLTQEIVDEYARFFEWLLDAPLTVGQQQAIRDELVAAWAAPDTLMMAETQEILQQWQQVSALTGAERDLVRVELEPALLAELRLRPDDAGAQWALEVWESAHVPLVEGDPPLTRQVMDAYLEVQLLMLSVVMDGQPASIDARAPAFIDLANAWADSVAADYPTLAPEQQAQLATMPLVSAAIRAVWPSLPVDEQMALREEWAQVIRPVDESDTSGETEEPVAETPTEAASGGSSSSLAEAMSAYQQSQSTAAWAANMGNMIAASNYNVTSTLSGGAYMYR